MPPCRVHSASRSAGTSWICPVWSLVRPRSHHRCRTSVILGLCRAMVTPSVTRVSSRLLDLLYLSLARSLSGTRSHPTRMCNTNPHTHTRPPPEGSEWRAVSWPSRGLLFVLIESGDLSETLEQRKRSATFRTSFDSTHMHTDACACSQTHAPMHVCMCAWNLPLNTKNQVG